MPNLAARIAENLAAVRGQIAEAAARSGRAADQIALVAVTKYVPADVARLVVEAGCRELGESRPQALWDKAAALADLPVRWHLVGHLQRNKLRRTLPLLAMIHSIDSRRLLEAVDRECHDGGADGPVWPETPASGGGQESPPHRQRLPVLLEVNVSGEQAKGGFAPQEAERLISELPDCLHLSVCGLMCMAALEGGLEAARRDFAALRELRDRLRGVCPAGVTLDELSMGMSGDFPVAIEEGATIVRVGSALFEGIE
jgi:uncharacterized pyridoxal phosphate-containing UPF0001 family protein